MKLIITADWHLGAGLPKSWGGHADARRRERTAAVLQIIEYARTSGARYLLVAGDIADCGEKVPESVVSALNSLHRDTGGRCRPVLFFTSAGHDRQRGWWKGDVLTAEAAGLAPTKLCRDEPPPPPSSWHLRFDDLFLTAHETLPHEGSEIHAPSGVPWVALVHAKRLPKARLADLARRASFVACGDQHQQRPLVGDRAWIVGAPSFRDLSSFDEGGRGFLEVDVEAAGTLHVRPRPVCTATSATVRVVSGAALGIRPSLSDETGDPVEAAIRLLKEHRYVRLCVPPKDVDAIQQRLSAATTADVIRWPSRGRHRTLLAIGADRSTEPVYGPDAQGTRTV